ncbi:MAG: hypothetical protein WDO24_10155 [Pseudomonadota bacterium]
MAAQRARAERESEWAETIGPVRVGFVQHLVAAQHTQQSVNRRLWQRHRLGYVGQGPGRAFLQEKLQDRKGSVEQIRAWLSHGHSIWWNKNVISRNSVLASSTRHAKRGRAASATEMDVQDRVGQALSGSCIGSHTRLARATSRAMS